MIWTQLARKCSTIILAASVFVTQGWMVDRVRAAESGPTVTLASQEILTSGATLKKYVWQSIRSNKEVKVNGNVIEVDLTNPHVKLDVMTGTENQFTRKQTVLEMTKETKAVAGVNGDFYNTNAEGVPIGPQVSSSQLMATPPYLPGFYSFALDKDNKPIVDLFTFEGTIKTKNGSSYPLGGINKTYYWFEPNEEHSHIDGLFMYTNAWGQVDRSNDGTTYPTEVLVQNGIITKVADNNIVNMIAPKDGYILRAAGKAADFVRENMKEGEPLMADYKVLPQDPSKKYDAQSFRMMIGGHTIMVDEGMPAAFSREVASLCCHRSRTAIGYSKDMKTAYLITVDNSGDSKGLSMTELQQFMIKVGVWKGLNLDGGGSTQMAARPLGEFTPVLVNKTETGLQRKVVNGVGVFSTAPKGVVKALLIQTPTMLFVNEQAALQYKAYDDYYNPVEMDKIKAQWSAADQAGVFQDNVFKPSKPGVAKVTAVSGKGSQTAEIEVIGREQLASLKIQADQATLIEGETYKLPVIATTKSGKSREVPSELIQWELAGIQGEIKNGILTVKSLTGSTAAQVIARYEGYSTLLTIPVGVDKVWYDLDKSAVMTLTAVKPDEVTANVDIKQTGQGNKYLELAYDFTQGQGTKWAFATLDTRVWVEGSPQYLKVNVNGDESLHWLRAEILDNNNDLHRVDLARTVNWKGWRQLTADLSDYKIEYPIRLKSVYVVNEEIGQDERKAKGTLGIDDITFTYQGELPQPAKSHVLLTVNKTSVSLNGKSMTLEQAPVITKGNTLVPIRFVSEALGGTVRWDEKERKVTVIRGDKLVDLWIDQSDLVVNGKRITAEVPPVLMNNLTMVPLRILSENLGWKVTWDGNTQQITLQ